MKIKLKVDLPIGSKHGMVKGSVLEAKINQDYSRDRPYWWVISKADNEPIGILKHEAEEIADDR